MSDGLIINTAIGIVITAMGLGFLKTIGYEYYRAVCWHNLRIEVQRLRREQERRLVELHGERDVIEGVSPAIAAHVDPIVGAIDSSRSTGEAAAEPSRQAA